MLSTWHADKESDDTLFVCDPSSFNKMENGVVDAELGPWKSSASDRVPCMPMASPACLPLPTWPQPGYHRLLCTRRRSGQRPRDNLRYNKSRDPHGGDDDDGAYWRVDDSDVTPEVVEASRRRRERLGGNRLGDFVCRLCRRRFEDAFCLAGHLCTKMEQKEYQCTMCPKVFNSPANLASHGRWHRPIVPAATTGITGRPMANAKARPGSGRRNNAS